MPKRWSELLAVCAIAVLATGCSAGEVVAQSRNEAVAEHYGTDYAEDVDGSLTNPGQPLDCVGAIGAAPRKVAKTLGRLGFGITWQEQWFDPDGSGRSRRTDIPPDNGLVDDVIPFPEAKADKHLLVFVSHDRALFPDLRSQARSRAEDCRSRRP
jgi:hypothetical protein